MVESTEQLRARGADITAVLCVIDRNDGSHSLLETAGIEMISLFTANDVR